MLSLTEFYTQANAAIPRDKISTDKKVEVIVLQAFQGGVPTVLRVGDQYLASITIEDGTPGCTDAALKKWQEFFADENNIRKLNDEVK